MGRRALSLALLGVAAIALSAAAEATSVPMGPRALHQVRVPHPDARRGEAVHLRLRAEGRREEQALPDPPDADPVQRRALRERRLPRQRRPLRGGGEGGLHLRLPGRARPLHVRGAVRGRAAVRPGEGPEGRGRVERHLGHDRVAAGEAPVGQRPRGAVRDLVPRLLREHGDDRRPPRARRDLAAGADRRLVRRGRLPPQRGLLPAPRLQLPVLVRPAAPRADHEDGGPLRPQDAGRLPLLPRRGADAELRPEVPEGRGGVLEGDPVPRHLRRVLAGAQHPPAPEGHPPRGPDGGRLVRRRGPLRRARDLQGHRAAEPRDREPAGDGPLVARRVVARDGRGARQGAVRPADVEVLPGGDRAAFFRSWLKDGVDPKLPEAYVFETGRNEWRSLDAWPPRDARPLELYLAANGACRRRRPPRPARPSTST